MKHHLLITVAILFVIPATRAQVLQKTYQKIQSAKNISYTDAVSTKMSYEDDFSGDILKSYITLNNAEPKTKGYFKVTGKKLAALYDGNKLITLNLTESTYTLSSQPVSGQYTRTLAYWANYISTNKKDAYIKTFKDTLINKVAYSHTRITTYDTITKGQHCYTFAELIINKRTLLPLTIISKIRGIGGDGSVGGWVEEHHYSNYRLNPPNFPNLTIASVPNGFKVPVSKTYKPLANGIKAPAINLYDAAGKTINLENLKGKMVLLNFTGLGCPHCVNAVQLMNFLCDKYKALTIVSAYPFDKHPAISKFDKKFAVKYSSYTADANVKNIFPHDGIPTFYLIDKDGMIVNSYSGYYQQLQDELIKQIDAVN